MEDAYTLVSVWRLHPEPSTYLESASDRLQSFDGDVGTVNEAKTFEPMQQVIVTKRLQEGDGVRINV